MARSVAQFRAKVIAIHIGDRFAPLGTDLRMWVFRDFPLLPGHTLPACVTNARSALAPCPRSEGLSMSGWHSAAHLGTAR